MLMLKKLHCYQIQNQGLYDMYVPLTPHVHSSVCCDACSDTNDIEDEQGMLEDANNDAKIVGECIGLTSI